MITHDHVVIKKWAEKYKGIPEIIDHADSRGDTIGIRINFPGDADDILMSDTNPPKKTSWEEFFKIFEEQGLAFEYENGEKVRNPGFAYRFLNRE